MFQVQAKTTSPFLTSVGMSTLRVLSPKFAGHAPSKDLITLKVLPSSSEIESWQEPPPWFAPPVMLEAMVSKTPVAIVKQTYVIC